MSKENLDKLIHWHKAQLEKQKEEQERLTKSILDTFKWLPQDKQDYIDQIASDLKKERDKIYLEVVHGARPWSLMDISKSEEEKRSGFSLWIEPLIKNKDVFLPFSEEFLNKDKLQAYRQSKFEHLRDIWEQRLPKGAKYLLAKLEAEYNFTYRPDEKELVGLRGLSKTKFQEYVKRTLMPRLNKLCSQYGVKELSRTKLWKIEAANFLKYDYPRNHFNPDRLWELDVKLRKKGALYLRQKYGEDPKVGDRIKEVFRKSRNRR